MCLHWFVLRNVLGALEDNVSSCSDGPRRLATLCGSFTCFLIFLSTSASFLEGKLKRVVGVSVSCVNFAGTHPRISKLSLGAHTVWLWRLLDELTLCHHEMSLFLLLGIWSWILLHPIFLKVPQLPYGYCFHVPLFSNVSFQSICVFIATWVSCTQHVRGFSFYPVWQSLPFSWNVSSIYPGCHCSRGWT